MLLARSATCPMFNIPLHLPSPHTHFGIRIGSRRISFLCHQVQHIRAVLFLVGTGLEQLSIISPLMNVFPAESNSLLSFHRWIVMSIRWQKPSLSCSGIVHTQIQM
ncbi:hypothetical protein BDR05DRAFT_642203 [Suillus weaverae]|nr:hypothetical protein BDR05DRAFT_642203 [Suillus weaverae]